MMPATPAKTGHWGDGVMTTHTWAILLHICMVVNEDFQDVADDNLGCKDMRVCWCLAHQSLVSAPNYELYSNRQQHLC